MTILEKHSSRAHLKFSIVNLIRDDEIPLNQTLPNTTYLIITEYNEFGFNMMGSLKDQKIPLLSPGQSNKVNKM